MAYLFKSKQDGMSKALRFHACLDCRYHQSENFKICPYCGSSKKQYFMSRTEFNRGMVLLTKRDAGTIEKLRFQPRYELMVNGRKIATLVLDAEYMENGQIVYEDSKPPNFIDKYALIKIKLFEAIHNVTVRIPQRKSGNRSKEKPSSFPNF